MKGQGGGGTAKGGGKSRSGGGSVVVKTVTVKKDKKCQQVEDNGHLILLRTALFEESGKDKDVTAGLAKSFMRFNRNGLDLQIEFCTFLQSTRDINKCFDLCKDNMEERYDASGYGWDDEDKLRELTEPGARFLLVREWPVEGDSEVGELVGFVHFRFTVLGEVIDSMVGQPCLHIYDIHLEDDIQRKGLGKHLLTVLELIGRREKMAMLSLAVQLNDDFTEKWVLKSLRGFEEDLSLQEHGFDAEMEGFRVFSKTFPAQAVTRAVAAVTSDTTAVPSPPSTESAEKTVPLPPPESHANNIVTAPKAVTALTPSSPSGATDVESACENSFSSDTSDGGWVKI
eukprot:gene26790-35477_t